MSVHFDGSRRALMGLLAGASLTLLASSALAEGRKVNLDAQVVFVAQGNPAYVDPKLRVPEAERRRHPAFANANRFFLIGAMNKDLPSRQSEARLDANDIRLVVTRASEEGAKQVLDVKVFHKNAQKIATRVKAAPGSYIFIVLPFQRAKENGRLVFALKVS